jgi:Fur family peroxide stress response transcriptional regulator
MKVDKKEVERRVSGLKKALSEAGIKTTFQRLEVFREVASSEDHPDAESIYKAVRRRIPTISLDTVYRTLWLLLDLGLISTLGPRYKIRFDANIAPHHHFVCGRCGLTRDFYSEEFDNLTVPEALKEFGIVERAQVEIKGVCSSCAKANETPKKKGDPR